MNVELPVGGVPDVAVVAPAMQCAVSEDAGRDGRGGQINRPADRGLSIVLQDLRSA